MITREQAEIAAKKLRQELPEEYEVEVIEVLPGQFLIRGCIPSEDGPFLNPTYIGATNMEGGILDKEVLSVVAKGGGKSTNNFYQAVDWIVETVNNIQRNKT